MFFLVRVCAFFFLFRACFFFAAVCYLLLFCHLRVLFVSRFNGTERQIFGVLFIFLSVIESRSKQLVSRIRSADAFCTSATYVRRFLLSSSASVSALLVRIYLNYVCPYRFLFFALLLIRAVVIERLFVLNFQFFSRAFFFLIPRFSKEKKIPPKYWNAVRSICCPCLLYTSPSPRD